MASYLITGSSRGLGLAMANVLAARPESEVSIVFTAARSKSEGLKKLAASYPGRTAFVKMDVGSLAEVREAAALVEQKLAGRGLDILINNAGVLPTTPEGIENMTDLDETFHTNVTGVHYVTGSLLPLLEQGNTKRVINVSSTVGSISMVHYLKFLKMPAYKVSKAALNMLTRDYASTMADRGFTFVVISPGYVRTDACGPSADLEVDEAIPPIFRLLDGITKDDNGKFLDICIPNFKNAYGAEVYKGGEAPW